MRIGLPRINPAPMTLGGRQQNGNNQNRGASRRTTLKARYVHSTFNRRRPDDFCASARIQRCMNLAQFFRRTAARFRALAGESLRHFRFRENFYNLLIQFDMISCGVFAGATFLYHVTFSNPGTPVSATVGIRGSRERCALLTASPLSLPL